ncbi:protein-glutamate O-methyltransferase CheR [Metabacillus sp. GX 13764]|uniref:CheR family methyltransferase n=1 Tax=Metabacillus kandeliae TaxID=2900151 RepID=UPI001E3C6A2C|nr:protein-glutamate O-methyltransferase CheR [Metabacillus kandeliae]MCD7033364.1 protein-glutamate O-methyltransferase CheR [Metabacillus kandeliae]
MDDYSLFVKNIKKKTGIDLSLYKEAQMKRRLASLLQKRGYDGFSSYQEALLKDGQLLAEFLDRMTINVSEFFRNKKRWDIFESEILPELLRGRSFKAWSAACSTGEEPYTMAMILSSHFPAGSYKLLATDLDENAIARAKLGLYSERSLAEAPKEMINRHFIKKEELYEVKDSIKNQVLFRKQNLLSDAFEKDFDLIVCRNVLIYFTEQAKESLYKKFSDALKPGGILFVGSTEQIFHPEKYGLEPADTFFYRKMM